MTPRSRLRLNVALLVVLLLVAALNLLLGTDPSRPNLEFLPDMAHAVPAETFDRNANFPDRKELQAPLPGTIPRGPLPLHYKATPEDAALAGRELRNPFTADQAAHRQRGALVYGNYCQVCHGPRGEGDGPVPLRSLALPRKSLLAENAVKMPDGQMFHVLTYGQGAMASYAGQLSRDDRWCVILHVRSLQPKAAEKGKP
jgi:mono/diheme cytochrome c family protein